MKSQLKATLIFALGASCALLVKEVEPAKASLTVAPVLEKSAFTVVYDGRSKNPYCTVELLTKESLQGSNERTNHQFKEDGALPSHLRAQLADYKGSGLDRGHLSPAANNKKSAQSMQESFLLSNICPQEPNFNRSYWANFERQVRDLTNQYKSVTVITGPLYLPQGSSGKRFVHFRVIGESDVWCPTHFFKVLRLEDETGSIQERAYVLPNEQIPSTTPLKHFETTVEKVERYSGIVFQNISQKV